MKIYQVYECIYSGAWGKLIAENVEKDLKPEAKRYLFKS